MTSIMEKLSVNSQAELISSVTHLPPLNNSLGPRVAAAEKSNPDGTHLFSLSDGRALEYNLYNRSCKRNLLYFPCLAGGKHWSDEAVAICKARDLRVLSPSRAGFGRSSPVRLENTALLDQHIADLTEFMDHVGINQDIVAVSYGSGFAPALRYAMSQPGRCRHLVAINPIPPAPHILDANTLKGVFKVAHVASRFAPRAYKSLAYLTVRFHRATRNLKKSPSVLPDFNLAELETESGFAAFLRNADDNQANGTDTLWREGTISLSDWLPDPINSNRLPKSVWVETTDSPFTVNGAFEEFRKSIRAKMITSSATFPLLANQLPDAFDVLGL